MMKMEKQCALIAEKLKKVKNLRKMCKIVDVNFGISIGFSSNKNVADFRSVCPRSFIILKVGAGVVKAAKCTTVANGRLVMAVNLISGQSSRRG